MKRTKPGILMSVVGLALILQSCATIFGGRSNSLVFNDPGNTKAQVFLDDTLIGDANGKIVLAKKTIQHGSKLQIRAEGYESQEYLILLKPHAGYVLADFAVGAIPLIFDYATGDILRPKPRKFDINLEKSE